MESFSMSIKRIQSGARMSQAVVHAGTAYLAGQVAPPASGETTVAGQTKVVLQQIDTLLAEAGTSKEHILSATIWLADMATFDQMNSVWDKWVAPGNAPARATVEAKLAGKAHLVEIAVIAAVA
jgi:enamine deaminase RidA (YjgF/YER057c/UK114 family)